MLRKLIGMMIAVGIFFALTLQAGAAPTLSTSAANNQWIQATNVDAQDVETPLGVVEVVNNFLDGLREGGWSDPSTSTLNEDAELIFD